MRRSRHGFSCPLLFDSHYFQALTSYPSLPVAVVQVVVMTVAAAEVTVDR